MQFDVNEVDRLSDSFVNAALDAELWPALLYKLSVATASFGINILPLEGLLPGGLVATESLAPAMEAYFSEQWYLRDHRAYHKHLLPKTGIFTDLDFAGEDDFKRLGFYRSQEKFKLRWTAIVGFGADRNRLAMVFQRRISDGPFLPDELRILRHLRQKLMISALIMQRVANARVQGMLDAYETAGVACILYDRKGLVMNVNQKARGLLGRDMQVSMGRLRLRDARQSAAFDRQLAAVLNAGPIPRRQTLLINREFGRPLIARLQGIGGQVWDVFGNPAALSIIDDVDDQRPVDEPMLREMFSLTKREAEIASLAASGMALKDMGVALGMSYETSRTHLRSIFRKTGTSRQSELTHVIERLRLR